MSRTKDKPRSEMGPEELRRARSLSKKRRIMRDLGQGALTTPEETDEAITHCQYLHSKGMTSEHIAHLVGDIHPTSVMCYVRGSRTGPGGRYPLTSMRRAHYEAVMRIRFEAPTPGHGVMISPVGGARRLQALIADGFGYNFLTREVTEGAQRGNSYTWKIAMGQTKGMLSSTHERIARVYDKLDGVDALDMLSVPMVTRTKNAAIKNGFAPRHCWDSDTIDNPDAIPEWTGACGTPSGHYLHRKYKIYPICPPCIESRAVRRLELMEPGREGRDVR